MNERDIFIAALQIDDKDLRIAFMDDVCAGDLNLRKRVDALLGALHQAGSYLQQPAAAPLATLDQPLLVKPGAQIGPYKLLQEIGQGGMGVVHMAEQTEPIRRRVALKIIKPGMDTHQVIARFEAERQALSLMDHPNIAKVLDAGTTAPASGYPGRPYFVMELVHGVPITQFCDDNMLTPRERLALFVPVCQAIQHAHQKGIIHRDIKPSNVLVTMYDDKPVPKVIDFGVAKAIEQRLTEKTMFTHFGALVGTLEYMSPEQAEMNAFGVDTRSDIYSLGVLLYELLTGTTPLEKSRLRTAALDELVRLIREEEAPRPSKRLSTSNTLQKVAAARKTEPERLLKLVRGEIDWIVMKCLEKDRTRRYETAYGLARDVQRYLADEPVEACPPSASYLLRKLARKYRKSLATAAAFVALLVAGVVLFSLLAAWATSAKWEADRYRQAAEAAKREAVDARDRAEKQRDEARLTAYATGIGLAQNALYENNVLRARELLATLPTEAGGRDLRGFEWHYLTRLCANRPATIEGHTDGVNSVAFSPDGSRLASASRDKTVRVWEIATGKHLFSLEVHNDSVTSVAFSPDGSRLASASHDKTVRVWESTTGKLLLSLEGHVDQVTSVAFSPDGSRLASASHDKTVQVWESATGKHLSTLEGHNDWVTSVAFSPDGNRLVSGSHDGTVKIWDCTTGHELTTLGDHGSPVRCVAFTPDGNRLASGGEDRFIRIWDSATGQQMVNHVGHTGMIRSVAFSPDGRRLASGSNDNTVKIWDSKSGEEIVSYREHLVLVSSVAFSPDGSRLASASGDGTLKIWDGAPLKEPFSFKFGSAGLCLAFSPDGRRLASRFKENAAMIWDAVTGQELVSLKGHTKPIVSMAFSPDGQRLASGSADFSVRIWDSATGRSLHVLQGHADIVHCVAFSPNGRWLVSASRDAMKLWDTANFQELPTFRDRVTSTFSAAFSPDSRRLATGTEERDGTVNIRDCFTGRVLYTLKGQAYGVRSVAFSPNGKLLASAGGDHTLKIWDSETGQELRTLKGHAVATNCLAFSPDGQRLASGSSDLTVKIWDIASGKQLITFKGNAGPVRDLSFSPDGQRLATANQDGIIIFWEANIPPEVRQRRAADSTR